jgi:predicted DNA-binding protein
MTQRKIFDRDEQIGFRCPRDMKARLAELARKRTRDMSSLALEFVKEGIERVEREQNAAPSGRHPAALA